MKTFLSLLFTFLFIPVAQASFSDLPESDPHFGALSYLEYEGVIGGYSDGTVRPNNQINRAELVKILVEGLGKKTKSSHKNCFPDVKEEWFAKYVCYALDQDWVKGYPDGTYQPSQNVNRVEALKIILNAFEIKQGTPNKALFKDTPFDAWYAPYLESAKQKNFLEESGNYFYPSNDRTRGEVAEMVARIMQIDYMDDPVWTEEIGAEFSTFLLLLKLRKDNGVTTELRLKKELTMSARDHAKDMAENIGDMSHQGSDGSQSWDRIKKYYNYPGRAGENVGKGVVSKYRSPYQAVKDVHTNIFMPEPHECHNHRTTILATCLKFTDVGIGVYVKDGKMYFTEDFTTGESSVSTDNPGMAVPEEYSGSKYDVMIDDGGEYTFTTVQGCNNDRVRLKYFIDSGVYLDNDNCTIYELAINPDGSSGFSVMPDEVSENLLINLNYTSNIYGYTTIEFDDAYVSANTSSYNGWEITSHTFPYDFNIGDVVDISFKNNNKTIELRFDFSEKEWVKIQQI